MRIKTPQATMEGAPGEILEQLSQARKFDSKAGDELIEEITHAAWLAFGVGLQVSGDTYAERAESLLRELDSNNMIKIEEE